MGLLLTEYRQSTRQVRSFLSEVMGLDISNGGIECVKNRLTKSFKNNIESIRQHLQSSSAVNMDETSWSIQNNTKQKTEIKVYEIFTKNAR